MTNCAYNGKTEQQDVIMDEFIKLLETAYTSISPAAIRGAEYIWPLLVRQAWVAGIINAIGAGFTSVGAVLSAVFMFVGIAHARKYNDEFWCGATAGGFVLTLVLLVITAVLVVQAVGFLLNPEYYAIMDIKNLVLKK